MFILLLSLLFLLIPETVSRKLGCYSSLIGNYENAIEDKDAPITAYPFQMKEDSVNLRDIWFHCMQNFGTFLGYPFQFIWFLKCGVHLL